MQTQFWIMAANAPAGPFSVDEIHRKLERNEVTWQTAACAVGDRVWTPLAKTPGFGPNVKSVSIEIPEGNRELIALPYLLRTLIAIDVGVVFLAIILTILDLAGDHGHPHDPSIAVLVAYVVILFPATIAAWIGTWLIKNWGRWMYLGAVGLGHFLNLIDSLFDVSAGWHFPKAVGDIATTIDGVIIGIVFFSTLAVAFRESGTNRTA